MTAQERRFGPVIAPDGVTFRLWAPGAKEVALVAHDTRPMRCDADGWFSIVAHDAGSASTMRSTFPIRHRAFSPRT